MIIMGGAGNPKLTEGGVKKRDLSNAVQCTADHQHVGVQCS